MSQATLPPEASPSVVSPTTPVVENPTPVEHDEHVIVVRPAAVLPALGVLVAILAVTGTLANLVIYQIASSPEAPLAKVAQRFDLGHEPSLPAWYSSLALLGAALLLAVSGMFEQRRRSPDTKYWFGLSVLFVGLALDETLMFHEMVDTVVSGSFHNTGVLYFAWVIPGLAFVGVVGLLLLGFLRRLDPRTRWLFLASGAIFVGGAVGMEMVAGVIVEKHGVESLGHTFSQAVEETGEMLGVLLFVYALLDRLARNASRLTLKFETRPGVPA